MWLLPWRMRKPSVPQVFSALMLAGMVFAGYKHWEYRGQNPGVQPKFMVNSVAAWKTTKGPLVIVKRIRFDYYYNCWTYEVRQGPSRFEALETELEYHFN